jgi:hypothetical protein
MDRIIDGNGALGQLVNNRWLTVIQIAPDGSLFERRDAGNWVKM